MTLPTVTDLLAGCGALSAAVLYAAAAASLRRRRDRWPSLRQGSFLTGAAGLLIAAVVRFPLGGFAGHIVQHLIVGMIAPVLLVLGRPVTLALRALAGNPRRLLLRLLHGRAIGWVMFPPAAALLEVGGLWVLYRTRLLVLTEHHWWLHAVVHLHMLTAGLLFTASICQLDPVRRRYSFLMRAGTLVAAGAAHSILAKSLYVTAPPLTHFPVRDTGMGSELMYYGGDLLETSLALVIALQWYADTGRALARERRRTRPVPETSAGH